MSTEIVYSMIIVLLSIGLIQEYLENLILFLRFPTILNYKLDTGIITSKLAKLFQFFFNSPGIWMLVIGQLILSILFLFGGIFQSFGFWVPALILLLDFASFFRLRYLPFSFKPLQRILLIAVCIHLLYQDNSISQLCVFVMAFFLCLSYVSSGYQKLVTSEWQTGKVIEDLWKENNWSFGLSKTFLKWLGYSVIFFELTFPVALVHDSLLYIYLIWGILFHGFLYIKLNYNFFFWTFVSAYPALVFTSEFVQTKLQELISLN